MGEHDKKDVLMPVRVACEAERCFDEESTSLSGKKPRVLYVDLAMGRFVKCTTNAGGRNTRDWLKMRSRLFPNAVRKEVAADT